MEQKKYEERDIKLELIKEYLPILKAQNSFYEFAKQAWSQIEGPDKPFVDGWHIGAICEHLEAVYRQEIHDLIINIPPRCMKSNLVAVMFIPWVWISEPGSQFLCSSYALSLSVRDSVRCRRLIASPWFQRRWGHVFNLVGDQNTKIKFENDKGGYRISTSTRGSATGEGGQYLICDDANNAKDGESEKMREGTNDWWAQVWSTRGNRSKLRKPSRIVIQQRMHENDLTGYLMANDKYNKWVKLILPMEFENARRSKTIILPSTNGKVWEDPRQKEGDLLWPELLDDKAVKDLKEELSTQYRIAGQLQQSPSPGEGGIIKKAWFQWWKKPKPPKLTQVVQSWDTALEANEMDAYSACTTWGLFEDDYKRANLILLGLWRGRVEYPELRSMAQKLFKDYRDDGSIEITPDGNHIPDMVLVEAKASGSSLIQDLSRAGVLVFGFNPGRYGDKLQRVRLATPMIEGGRVWVPARPPNYTALRDFSNTLVELCSIFPNSDSRDVVDTMTQVILRLTSNGYLKHPKDEPRSEGVIGPKHGFYGAAD